MRKITIREAIVLIQNCSAVIIDNVVTYPNLEEELSGEPESCWLEICWIDDDNDFVVSFSEDCGTIEFDGTNLFINDIDGDQQMIVLLVPMKHKTLIYNNYMSIHHKFLTDIYLNYCNDFITLSYMAEHYAISISCMKAMVDEGRKLHEEHVGHIKACDRTKP
jgi:hypothetical protein